MNASAEAVHLSRFEKSLQRPRIDHIEISVVEINSFTSGLYDK